MKLTAIILISLSCLAVTQASLCVLSGSTCMVDTDALRVKMGQPTRNASIALDALETACSTTVTADSKNPLSYPCSSAASPLCGTASYKVSAGGVSATFKSCVPKEKVHVLQDEKELSTRLECVPLVTKMVTTTMTDALLSVEPKRCQELWKNVNGGLPSTIVANSDYSTAVTNACMNGGTSATTCTQADAKAMALVPPTPLDFSGATTTLPGFFAAVLFLVGMLVM